jgi:sulfatase maturation enzyme AslB (radical SAM superfamily)
MTWIPWTREMQENYNRAGTPIPPWENSGSCRWSKKEERYITLAEDWIRQWKRRKRMTWLQLLDFLTKMNEINHTCMGKQVCALVDREVINVDLYESLTSGDVILTQLVIDADEGE